MSAFLCEDELFFALASVAVTKNHSSMRVEPKYLDEAKLKQSHIRPASIVLHGDEYDPDRKIAVANFYAEVLKYENHIALNSRYGDSLENIILFEKPLRRIPPLKLSPAQLFKMCSCINYQCSEHDNYEDSFAYYLLERIRGSIPSLLPDYESASWGCPEHVKADYTGEYQNHSEDDGISLFMLSKQIQAKEAKQ